MERWCLWWTGDRVAMVQEATTLSTSRMAQEIQALLQNGRSNIFEKGGGIEEIGKSHPYNVNNT
ncbi:hypothetical protein DEO72_LG5g2853 [Vigna unguiculata]|uniref:Uncharacterized protein n=1 Tax=Vigna unguiculata TaxID=3917 RepID=A0A4D6M3K6_VIGUN|nr:hypothetical protein DEO72_LG5g2853 [Vigna unguiculata]